MPQLVAGTSPDRDEEVRVGGQSGLRLCGGRTDAPGWGGANWDGGASRCRAPFIQRRVVLRWVRGVRWPPRQMDRPVVRR